MSQLADPAAPTPAPAPAPAAGERSTSSATRSSGLLAGTVLGVVLLVLALAVALLTGTSTGDADPAAGAPAAGTRTVAVRLVHSRIVPAAVQVAPGTRLVLDVTNADTSMAHDLVLRTGAKTPLLAPGETFRLDAGVVTASLQGWCSVPGHRAAGMRMTVAVTAATSADAGTTADAAPAAAPAIDFQASPGPDWKPSDPTLRPADGAAEHRLTLRVTDTVIEVAPGVRQRMWTYNGTVPGPTLRGRVGDLFTITFVNDGSTGHGMDFHAGSLAPDRPTRTIAPGESLTYQFTAGYAGAWLYHCSTMPMSLHIANGMFGAVIIDPPGLPRVDRELLLVQSELYLGKQGGVADEGKIAAERPDAVVFNGYVNQYEHAPIQVGVGERVRVWVVDAGPQRATAFHVVGAQFDTVFKEGAYLLRPGNAEHGAAQVLDLAPAQGGFVEFALPEAGRYPLTDHAMVDAERGAVGVFEAR